MNDFAVAVFVRELANEKGNFENKRRQEGRVR